MPNPIPDARSPVTNSVGAEDGISLDPQGTTHQQLYVETLVTRPLGGAPPVGPVVMRDGIAETILPKDEA